VDTSSGDSIFRQAALTSGLVDERRMDAALRLAQESAEGATAPVADDVLADALIELGVVNRWQVNQLREGRTKFTLGPYRIIDSIGRGGMGHVFKAEHAMLGRTEAVKVLPKSRSTAEAVASFQREIRAQARLDHPNLVRVLYAGQDGETYFFVTEYVAGSDLRRLVRGRGPLNMQEAATIISQAAQGLYHAHQRGLVHRDVKPGNLLVTLDGRTKVTDLGLAWFLADENAEEEHDGKIVGTADYLAPEVIQSHGEVSQASDIYALGCTAYYAVTGKVPFPGGATSEKLRWHCEARPLNPQRFNPGLSGPFVAVLADMMEKDPARRIGSAQEVVDRLAPWTLGSAPVSGFNDPQGPAGVGSPGPFLPAEFQLDAPQPSFGDQFAIDVDQDSFGQVSDGTSPSVQISQETVRVPARRRSSGKRRRRRLPNPTLVTLLLVPLVVLVVVLTLMVMELIKGP